MKTKKILTYLVKDKKVSWINLLDTYIMHLDKHSGI